MQWNRLANLALLLVSCGLCGVPRPFADVSERGEAKEESYD